MSMHFSDDIRTFLPDPSLEQGGFLKLDRMESIFDHAQGQTDTPHRHSYFTVLWVIKGVGTHQIDFNEYSLGESQVFFISPGQIHQLVASERPMGWVITFSPEFLEQNHISEEFIAEINLFYHFDERPPIYLPQDVAEKAHKIFDLMAAFYQEETEMRTGALSACLKLFLILCCGQCIYAQLSGTGISGGKSLIRQFKLLVMEHFRSLHKVSEYAERMHITPKYLNQVVKSYLGQTAKEVIQEKLILNAKRELTYSDKSIKEIALELGFEEPLYFSSFFKKCVGISPSAFKENPDSP